MLPSGCGRILLFTLVPPDQSLASRLVVKPGCDTGDSVCGARVEREYRLSTEP